ncbi:MAG: glycosyltransferase family 25 protein [Rikenellaceae bacterium]
MVKVDKVFVAHVKKGSEHRAIAMEKQLAKLGIEFEYMLGGDIEDITAERLEKYFVPDVENSIVGRSKSHISCALKHILIFEEVVKQNLNRILVLEDDAILTSDFVEKFNK